jgi:DNA polymerase-3 subunit epsilon/exodeoxyribonuclease X
MLVFLDIETTGLDSSDKVCSIAVVTENEEYYDLVNEGKKIPPMASSINHITNEMIAQKPPLKESDTFRFLQMHNNDKNTIIGHNIKFDLDKLYDVGFSSEYKVIDTLRVVKHLIPECEYFSLQFLRYELRLYQKETTNIFPHHATSDALVTKNLFEYLLDITSIEEMYKLSYTNVLMPKLNFGKYSGHYIEDIATNDRNYLLWLLRNVADLDEDLRYSINYYMDSYITEI